jgi:hypothetical protein
MWINLFYLPRILGAVVIWNPLLCVFLIISSCEMSRRVFFNFEKNVLIKDFSFRKGTHGTIYNVCLTFFNDIWRSLLIFNGSLYIFVQFKTTATDYHWLYWAASIGNRSKVFEVLTWMNALIFCCQYRDLKMCSNCWRFKWKQSWYRFLKYWVNHSVACRIQPSRSPDLTSLYLFHGDSKVHCVPGRPNNSGKYAPTYYW